MSGLMLPRMYKTDTEIRKRQINTLKIFNANVTEIVEGTEYQIQFTAGGRNLTLHILLDNDFPTTKPVLTIIPPVMHSWIGSNGEIVSAPGLVNFTIHSDLGRVVQAIIREFERTSPPLASDSSTTTSMPTFKDSERMNSSSPFYSSQLSPPTHSILSTYQSPAFPELSSMALGELEFLNESPERQDEYLDNLIQTRQSYKYINDLMQQIEELADSNLSKEQDVIDLTKQIDEKIEEVTKLAFENERLNVTYKTLSDKYSPKNINFMLSEAAKQANIESDKVATTFLKRELDVETFLLEYLDKRTLGQTRRTKEEKLTRQLKNLERAGF